MAGSNSRTREGQTGNKPGVLPDESQGGEECLGAEASSAGPRQCQGFRESKFLRAQRVLSAPSLQALGTKVTQPTGGIRCESCCRQQMQSPDGQSPARCSSRCPGYIIPAEHTHQTLRPWPGAVCIQTGPSRTRPEPRPLALPGIQTPHPESWQRAVAYRTRSMSSASRSPAKKVTRNRKKKLGEMVETGTLRASTS